jgi:HEAT repeat protein
LTFEQHLLELGDESRPLRHAGLLPLSGLLSEELDDLRAAWLSLSPTRRCEILGALVALGEDNIELDFTSVFRISLADEDEQVRERATRGLWECEDRAVIRPLIALMQGDRSVKVRVAAAMSLGNFVDMAQDGKLLPRDGDRMREAFMAVIDNVHEEPEVRRRSIEAVASFQTPEIEKIIRQAYEGEDSKLRQSAVYAMGRNSDTMWLPLIIEELEDPDAAMRYEAANACGALGDESTVPHLIRLIDDDDFEVQISAIQALGNVGGSLAKRALLQCLKMGDEALEEAVQTALSNIEFDEDPLGFQFHP